MSECPYCKKDGKLEIIGTSKFKMECGHIFRALNGFMDIPNNNVVLINPDYKLIEFITMTRHARASNLHMNDKQRNEFNSIIDQLQGFFDDMKYDWTDIEIELKKRIEYT